MESAERKSVALKFCSLSPLDQRSVLVQLPSHTKTKLLSVIESLEPGDFNQPLPIETSLVRDLKSQTSLDLQDTWASFTYMLELRHSEAERELPKHLLRAIKELNQ
jgi:hypothetical protein